jgi:hypothetical protein
MDHADDLQLGGGGNMDNIWRSQNESKSLDFFSFLNKNMQNVTDVPDTCLTD